MLDLRIGKLLLSWESLCRWLLWVCLCYGVIHWNILLLYHAELLLLVHHLLEPILLIPLLDEFLDELHESLFALLTDVLLANIRLQGIHDLLITCVRCL